MAKNKSASKTAPWSLLLASIILLVTWCLITINTGFFQSMTTPSSERWARLMSYIVTVGISYLAGFAFTKVVTSRTKDKLTLALMLVVGTVISIAASWVIFSSTFNI